jgi:hypothetical protein
LILLVGAQGVSRSHSINGLEWQRSLSVTIGPKRHFAALATPQNKNHTGPPEKETAAPDGYRGGGKLGIQTNHSYRNPDPSSNWQSIGQAAARVVVSLSGAGR